MEKFLYDSNEMIKAGCNDCQGCFDCCVDMGQSILLDPYDIYLLEENLHCSFEELLLDKVELQVSEGMILPNLKMQKKTDRCGFLNAEGRCSIHDFRPGLCRLFPLGRNYADGKLQYFLLENACKKQNTTKVKIKKWLAVPALRQYEEFLVKWHDFRKDLQAKIAQEQSDEVIKEVNMKQLYFFYQMPYTSDDFYKQFEERMEKWNAI